METRASYALVGAFVLALLAGLAGFTVWLFGGADDDTQLYDIVFTGSVTGLQEGGQVRYRGVPVGTVMDIWIEPDDTGRVVVTAEIEENAPIREDTVASLELLGVTGIAYVQLSEAEGPVEEPPPVAGTERPVIPAVPSALEQVFESTPELLARAVEVGARLTEVLDDANLDALGGTLRNLEAITAALAGRADGIGAVVEESAEAAEELRLLASELRALVGGLSEQTEGLGGEVTATLREVRSSVGQLGEATEQLEGVVREVRPPLNDFAESGLYDFSQLIGETRLLVAALSRITKEFERNPAGFLLGTNQGGFEAQ